MKAVRLKDGAWRVRLRVADRELLVFGATEEEAKAKAYVERLRISKVHVEVGTLGYIVDRYIERYAPQLSPTTVRGYKAIRENRFEDYMDLRPDGIDFQEMLNAEQCSPKTLKNAWGLVKASLLDAGYNAPRVSLAPVPVNYQPYLQPEEIGPFLREIRGKPYEFAALLELNGLRYSEMRALTPDKVRNGQIIINGAMVMGENGLEYKAVNKTKASTRTVPILIPRIEELGWGKVEIGHKNLSLDIQRACRDAGVTVCRNHDLRRSFATLCWYLQIDAMQVAQWGGWSDITTIVKFYARLSASAMNENARKMRAFFGTELASETREPPKNKGSDHSVCGFKSHCPHQKMTKKGGF